MQSGKVLGLMREYFGDNTTLSRSKKLINEQISKSLPIEPKRSDWKITDDGKSLIRSYSFKEFRSLVNFINDLLQMQNETKHHGQVLILEKEVRVKVSTESLQRITELDTEYAAQLDMIYKDSQIPASEKDEF